MLYLKIYVKTHKVAVNLYIGEKICHIKAGMYPPNNPRSSKQKMSALWKRLTIIVLLSRDSIHQLVLQYQAMPSTGFDCAWRALWRSSLDMGSAICSSFSFRPLYILQHKQLIAVFQTFHGSWCGKQFLITQKYIHELPSHMIPASAADSILQLYDEKAVFMRLLFHFMMLYLNNICIW